MNNVIRRIEIPLKFLTEQVESRKNFMMMEIRAKLPDGYEFPSAAADYTLLRSVYSVMLAGIKYKHNKIERENEKRKELDEKKNIKREEIRAERGSVKHIHLSGLQNEIAERKMRLLEASALFDKNNYDAVLEIYPNCPRHDIQKYLRDKEVEIYRIESGKDYDADTNEILRRMKERDVGEIDASFAPFDPIESVSDTEILEYIKQKKPRIVIPCIKKGYVLPDDKQDFFMKFFSDEIKYANKRNDTEFIQEILLEMNIYSILVKITLFDKKYRSCIFAILLREIQEKEIFERDEFIGLFGNRKKRDRCYTKAALSIDPLLLNGPFKEYLVDIRRKQDRSRFSFLIC